MHIYYIALPSAELATQRVALRVKVGGHNITPDDIARRFQRSLHNLFALYLPLADRWRVLNNATGALTSIARGTAHGTYLEDPGKWLNLQLLGQ